MRKLAYIGAGRLAEQLASLLEPSLPPGGHQSVYFGQVTEGNGTKVVLPFDQHLGDAHADREFYLGLGYHQIPRKRAVLHALKGKGRKLPPLVHPAAYVHPSSKIGDGCVIYPGAVVGPNCVLEGGVLLNTGVNLAHDVVIGEASYLSPSVTLSGFCRIGAECFLGTGTLVSNDLAVGDRCVLGIGTVVTHALPDDTQGLGNPFQARKFTLT